MLANIFFFPVFLGLEAEQEAKRAGANARRSDSKVYGIAVSS